MTDKLRRKNRTLDLREKLRLVEWMETNIEKVTDTTCRWLNDIGSDEKAAPIATKDLGFEVTQGNIKGTRATLYGEIHKEEKPARSAPADTEVLEGLRQDINKVDADTRLAFRLVQGDISKLQEKVHALAQQVEALTRDANKEKLASLGKVTDAPSFHRKGSPMR